MPIVEPELLIDGAHSPEQFAAASQRVISACIAQLWRRNVQLEATLLKPQMMIAGSEYTGPKDTPRDTAQRTLE